MESLITAGCITDWGSFFLHEIKITINLDEEFIKNILLKLKDKNILTEIKKNSKGKQYKRRSRWKLTEQAYNIYKDHQKINRS